MHQAPIYTPLPPQFIRLLTISPPINPESLLSCKLSPVHFSPSLVYEALSYAWGTSSVKQPIVLNEHEFQAPIVVQEVLLQLRYPDRERHIWIDFLCINQDDITERSQQIPLMRDIYRSAESVCVWLGPADAADARVMGELKKLSSRGPDDSSEIGFLTARDEAGLLMLEQFEHFFQRSWWGRLWVVQEVVLSTRAVFQCGPDSIDFDDLSTVFISVHLYFDRHHHADKGKNLMRLRVENIVRKFTGLSALREFRFLCMEESRQSTAVVKQLDTTKSKAILWFAMANSLRTRSCLLSHDRVYAVHGLLPAEIVKDPRLVPSYSISAEEAYTRAALAVMEASQSLAIFSYLDMLDDTTNLPSWVPHWHSGIKNHQNLGLRLARESLFSAGSAEPFMMRQVSKRDIVVKGLIMDRITECLPADFKYPLLASLDACLQKWRQIWTASPGYQEFIKGGITEDQLEDLFRRTVLWDCAPAPHGVDAPIIRLTKRELHGIFEAYRCGLQPETVTTTSDEIDFEVLHDNMRRQYIASNSVDRVFFMTTQGFIGMAEHNIAVGDCLSVVAGNALPVVLRHSDTYSNTWRAVSECYYHGWMDGEAVAMVRSGQMDVVKPQMNVFDLFATDFGHLPKHPLSDKLPASPENGWFYLLIS